MSGVGPARTSGSDPGRRIWPLSLLVQELARAPGDADQPPWIDEPRPGDRIGRFEIRDEVGRGGFGAVYEARDTELGRPVALKAVRPRRVGASLSDAAVKTEAEAVAKLDHPCIVTLFDAGTSERGPYLVMELLRGETLARRLAAGPMASPEALRIAEQIAQGLAHAHGRSVLHRDLKPSNVFLCEDGRVKLLDFGLAHLLGAGSSGGSGTPGYMPPEQAQGQEVDARADVYAAAMTLREMLTGERVPALGDRVPRPLLRPLARALATDREARPPDGSAWLAELRAARAAMERPRRVRRLAGLAVACLALGAAAAYLHARRPGPAEAGGRGGVSSVAVLPFVDASQGQDQGHLADGIAEEVLNALSRVEGLKVAGRSSSFSFRGRGEDLRSVGQKLGVGHVVEGTVRREGDAVRVTAQLVRTGDGSVAWSDAFDVGRAGIFTVQERIARSIAEALEVRLVPDRAVAASPTRSPNPEAYDLFLLGRYLNERGAAEYAGQSVAVLERSIALDSGYAPAHAMLFFALRHLEQTPEVRRRRKAAAERAVELDPLSPAAHAARAAQRSLEGDEAGARRDVERSLELGPSDVVANMFAGVFWAQRGRLDEAVARGRRATEIDPLDTLGWNNLGTWLTLAGDLEGARGAFRRALDLNPEETTIHCFLADVDLLAGSLGPALEGYARCPRNGYRLAGVAMAQHSAGRKAESDAALSELEGRGNAVVRIASAHAWRGERDEAFAWLDRLDRDGVRRHFLPSTPFLKALHEDPRFPALLRKLGLAGE